MEKNPERYSSMSVLFPRYWSFVFETALRDDGYRYLGDLVYCGRKPMVTTDRIGGLCGRAASGEKKTVLAREFGISRETVYQYLEPPNK